MHDHGHAQTRCAISAVAEVLVIFKTKIFYRLPVPVITLFKIIRGHWYQSKARIYATDFLLVINTNLRVYPISHRFQVIADYWWNLRFRHTRSEWIPKLTTTIFGYVRLSVSESFAGMHGRILTKLYVITHVHIILFVCVLIYLYRPSCMCDCICVRMCLFFFRYHGLVKKNKMNILPGPHDKDDIFKIIGSKPRLRSGSDEHGNPVNSVTCEPPKRWSWTRLS